MGVFDAFKSLFGANPATNEEDADQTTIRQAATALMVQLAQTDGAYDPAEQAAIRRLVSETFDVTGADLDALITAAEAQAETAIDHYAFTKHVKRLPKATREALVEGLWEIVFADGHEAGREDAFVRRVADLLYVDLRASRLARQRAQDLSSGS